MKVPRLIRRVLLLPDPTTPDHVADQQTPFTRDMHRIQVASRTRQRELADRSHADTGNLIEAVILGESPARREK